MAKSRRPPGESRPKTKVELERALRQSEAGRKREVAARIQADAAWKQVESERDDALRRLAKSEGDRTEALDQQTATSEILGVISSSPTDTQPVFDTIVRNAARVCEAFDAILVLADGDDFVTRAHHGPIKAVVGERFPLRGTVGGRALLESRVVQVANLAEASDYSVGRELAQRVGYRTTLSVPLLRDGAAIGLITIRRTEVLPFTDKQIEVLQTFADQAVIAIENVRLFTELQASNRETTEALERQTATAEILQVIGRSPTDSRPVFESIARSGHQVCGALGCVVFIVQDGMLHVAATYGVHPERVERFRSQFPVALSAGIDAAQTVAGSVFHLADIEHNPLATEEQREVARLGRYQTRLMVPMVRGGVGLGLIAVTRADPAPFPDRQVELMKTFADQAVIAIENVRLFTALQASNRDLTSALDTQTATGDILRVISRSRTDVQPVFDAIVQSAVRLLAAHSGSLTRLVDDQIELAALTSTDNAGDADLRSTFPRSLHSAGSISHAIRDRVPLHITDTEVDPRRPEALRAMARARGYRSQVVVPLLRHEEAIGSIALTRREPGGFTDDEIALLETFADQAVIAIENARLLTELQARTQELTRSVDQLTALGEVSRAVTSTLDLDRVLKTVVLRASQLAGADGCSIFEYDDDAGGFRMRATSEVEPTALDARRTALVPAGEGAVGRLTITRAPVQIADISSTEAYRSPLRDTLIAGGFRALLAVPMIQEDAVVGGLVVSRRTPGAFDSETVELLQTFANQSALAIANARLFREIEEKSAQLEVANQHKSEFLANMSHELRTPLNAVIGFSDVLLEGMFGEINEKQTEYLRDILSSGTHLLSLINDILDLSKIEAGRMELDLSDFDVPNAIGNALTLMRERASRHGIVLTQVVDDRLGEIRADERKFKQVLLNLLSNAVKFTPSGGKVEVRGRLLDGMVEVAVADTGEGIAPEDQQAVFEEFRQVGKSSKKIEGTGLGLALCRKFVELHGGTLGLESQVGVGSTFTFTVPVRAIDP